MMKCSKCGVERPLTDFVKDKLRMAQRTQGHHPSCKACRSQYYQQNRERILAQYKEYRTANVEALKLERHKYISRRFFYKRASNMMTRGNYERTSLPEKTAEISRLWKKQRGICPVTGRRLNRENAQIDHILPITRGGTHDIANLRWVHKDINYAKRDLIDAEFFRLCLDVASYLKKLSKPDGLNGDPQRRSPWQETLF
jgi:5-methylcytosine-specific restriction endonuclease McrA